MLRIRVAGADMVLHPSGAAFLSAEQTLLVADAHFGKAVSFRRLGVPVPSGTTSEILDGLSAAIAAAAAWAVRTVPLPKTCVGRVRVGGPLASLHQHHRPGLRAAAPAALLVWRRHRGVARQRGRRPAGLRKFHGHAPHRSARGRSDFSGGGDVLRAIPVLPVA